MKNSNCVADWSRTLLEPLEQRALLDGSPYPTLGMLENPNDAVVRMETRYGDVDIELFSADAPVATASFTSLLSHGAYAGTFFHRLDTGSRLRGGLDRFSNTSGLSQRAGLVDVDAQHTRANTEQTVAFAVNPLGTRDKSTGELVFNLADNSATGTDYLVLGKVVQGWSVVLQIASLPVLDLSGFFPGNPIGADLTKVPVTQADPPPTQVTESLLVSTGDVQFIKPQGVQAFYTEKVYFPEGYSWERTFEAVDLMNPGSEVSHYQILTRYETGSRDQVVKVGELGADRRDTIVMAPGFGQPSSIVRNNQAYAYEVWSTTPLVAGFRHKDFKAGVGESFFRPESLPDPAAMKEWSFFQAAIGPGTSETFILWQNITGTDTRVTAQFFFEDADPVSVSFNLGAHRRGGVRLRDVHGLPSDRTIVGARITAGQSIVASITRYDSQRDHDESEDESDGGSQVSTGAIAALGLPGGGATAGVAPGAKRGREDPLAILNTGTESASVTFFVTQEGSSTSVQRTVTVPAGRIVLLQGASSPSDDAQHGKFFNIRYSSDAPVTVGFVTNSARGTGTGTAVFAAKETHFADARSFSTPCGAPFGQQALSVFNPNSTAATYHIVFRFDNDAPFTSESFTIQPGQSTHQRIVSYAADLAHHLNGLGGLVRHAYSFSVVSDQPLVAQSTQLHGVGVAELGMTLDTWVPLSDLLHT